MQMVRRQVGAAEQLAGYGFATLPTYEKGWRYARPFVAADSAADPVIGALADPRISDLPWYYLRLEDMGIFTAYDKQNKSPEKLEELYQFGKSLALGVPAKVVRTL